MTNNQPLEALLSTLDPFLTNADECYVTMNTNGHNELYRVDSDPFWQVVQAKLSALGSAKVSNDDRRAAVASLPGRARLNKRTSEVFIRVAENGRRIYIDLATPNRDIVEVSATGWRIIQQAPVYFYRPKGMLPLPIPTRPGNLLPLRSLVNVASEPDYLLLVSWMLSALRRQAVYPVLVLMGEQGTAKSTLSKVIRALVDPRELEIQSLSKTEQDLAIAAKNAHLLAFDNLSNVPSNISDALCRLSTGGGLSTRRLYTNADEETFSGTRPFLLSGITDFVTKSDLADRAIFLRLPVIDKSQRLTESAFWARFHKDAPQIFAGLLDALVHGLANISSVPCSDLGRMADFEVWSIACEEALTERGMFKEALRANADAKIEDLIEGDPLAQAICDLMEHHPIWTGTSQQLMDSLVRPGQHARMGLPPNASALSKQLRASEATLRAKGIVIEKRRAGSAGKRIIEITNKNMPAEGMPEAA